MDLARTPSGIGFEELEGSPRIRLTQKGMEATRTFKVAWEDWEGFLGELVGYADLVAGALDLATPFAFPGFENLFVDSADVEPFEPGNPRGPVDMVFATNSYDAGAKVTVNYKTKDDNDDNDKNDKPEVPEGTFLTVSGDLGAEYQTIPGRVWKWSSDGAKLPADQNPGIVIPTIEWSMSWEKVPLPPWAAIRNCIGKVNKGTFNGAAEGHILFLGGKIQRDFSFQQTEALYKLDYKFGERNISGMAPGAAPTDPPIEGGWNHFYRSNPAPGGGIGITVEMVKDDAGKLPYWTTDMQALFKFGE